MQQWNIYRPNKTHGPFSPGLLKQFADTGKLRPSDIIGLVGSEERFQAYKVAGLFARSEMPSPAGNPTSEATAGKPLYIRVNGRTLGPFSREHLHKMAASGELTYPAEFSDDGLSWASAEHFSISSSLHASSLRGQHNFNASAPSPVSLATRDGVGPNEAEIVPKIWYVHVAGVNYGPVSQQKLIELRSEGRIKDDALLWRDGFENWIPIKHVIETKAEDSENATGQQWYIMKGDVRTGPFSEQSVRDQITTGKLSPANLVCPLGETAWRDASKSFSFKLSEGSNLVAFGQQQIRDANFQPPVVCKNPAYVKSKDASRRLGKGRHQLYCLMFLSMVAIAVVAVFFAFAAIGNRIPVVADLAREAGNENTSAQASGTNDQVAEDGVASPPAAQAVPKPPKSLRAFSAVASEHPRLRFRTTPAPLQKAEVVISLEAKQITALTSDESTIKAFKQWTSRISSYENATVDFTSLVPITGPRDSDRADSFAAAAASDRERFLMLYFKAKPVKDHVFELKDGDRTQYALVSKAVIGDQFGSLTITGDSVEKVEEVLGKLKALGAP